MNIESKQNPGRKPIKVVDRILSRVVESEDCWVWTGRLYPNGYGRSWIGTYKEPGSVLNHRAVYRALIGPIPKGLQLDHLCRNRACVNPFHLEPVTGRVNLMRGDTIAARNAAKTHCPKGHEYTRENTRIRTRGSRPGTYRACRSCAKIYKQLRYGKAS